MLAVDMELGIPPKQQAKRTLQSFSKVLDVTCQIKRQFNTIPKQNVGGNIVSASSSTILIHVEANSTEKLANFMLATYHSFKRYSLLFIGDDIDTQKLDKSRSFIKDDRDSPTTTSCNEDSTSIKSISSSPPVETNDSSSIFDSKWALLETYLTKLKGVSPESKSEDNTSPSYHSNPEESTYKRKPKQINHSPTLQRSVNTFQINSFEYDKTDCTTWSVESIRTILLTPRKQGGIGMSEEDIPNPILEGSILENIIEALLSFNGDQEAKIAHAVKEINFCENMVAKAVVRWVFRNLLEYK